MFGKEIDLCRQGFKTPGYSKNGKSTRSRLETRCRLLLTRFNGFRGFVAGGFEPPAIPKP